MNTDFGSYFLEGDQLVNYNSPFTGYSGKQVWQTVKNTVSSCLGWLADQLIAFVRPVPCPVSVFFLLSRSFRRAGLSPSLLLSVAGSHC